MNCRWIYTTSTHKRKSVWPRKAQNEFTVIKFITLYDHCMWVDQRETKCYLNIHSKWILILNSLTIMHWQFVLITSQTSVTITGDIQPTGVVTMAMKVLYITVVACAHIIYLICMPSGFGYTFQTNLFMSISQTGCQNQFYC